eukprot:NODE_921_length_3051_cov_0.675813.p2 type:complete len:219 gc:universal NODE_921_length_3051_cov_0.675813:1137-481(-)
MKLILLTMAFGALIPQAESRANSCPLTHGSILTKIQTGMMRLIQNANYDGKNLFESVTPKLKQFQTQAEQLARELTTGVINFSKSDPLRALRIIAIPVLFGGSCELAHMLHANFNIRLAAQRSHYLTCQTGACYGNKSDYGLLTEVFMALVSLIMLLAGLAIFTVESYKLLNLGYHSMNAVNAFVEVKEGVTDAIGTEITLDKEDDDWVEVLGSQPEE